MSMTDHCSHAHRRIIWVLTECEDCGRRFNERMGVDKQFDGLVLAVRQGKLPTDMAIQAAGLSDDQRRILGGITPCSHIDVEQYTCPATQKTRWRCVECRRAWDDRAGLQPTANSESR